MAKSSRKLLSWAMPPHYWRAPVAGYVQKASTSNSAAVGVSVGASAVAAALTVEVQQLARAQSTASAGVVAGEQTGASGSLNIELGSWNNAAPPSIFQRFQVFRWLLLRPTRFLQLQLKSMQPAQASQPLVLRDGTNERLVIRSSSTGTEAGFRLNRRLMEDCHRLVLRNPSDGILRRRPPIRPDLWGKPRWMPK
jgi:hypothetical protein